jgi:hypothetical protein
MGVPGGATEGVAVPLDAAREGATTHRQSAGTAGWHVALLRLSAWPAKRLDRQARTPARGAANRPLALIAMAD